MNKWRNNERIELEGNMTFTEYAEEYGIVRYEETADKMTWYQRVKTDVYGHYTVYKHTYDGKTETVTEMQRVSAKAKKYMN